ncbi:MAG: haloacid dehalogenase-like hydrolase [Oscillospiraceae bacterium]|nr:haloacid dehalogenase-like hydrolase [Oscillospiraceae bacterium]
MRNKCDIRQVNQTKIFDFDNTLYRGESAVDFALFMIRSNRKIIFWLPKIFWNLLKYKLCLVKKDNMEAQIDRFLQSCLPEPENLRRLVRQFWKLHIRKLDSGMISRINPEDVIITAGPAFLLLPIRKQLGTANLLCSEVDLSRKRVLYLNFSDHKVQRYRERFGQTPVKAFYTDSYNDGAMMQIAEKVYLVQKGNVRRIR